MSEPNATEPTVKPQGGAADPGAPAAPPAPQEGGPDLFGGRFLVGIALLVGIAAVAPNQLNNYIDRALYTEDPKPVAEWAIGGEANVELTLITADSRRLACAHDAVIDGVHCGYSANKRMWPRAPGAPVDDNDENIVQPFRTADNNSLILVSGLWAQPELALRVHREPPTYYDPNKQARFVAYCRVRFIGEMKGVLVRWDTGGKWAEEPPTLVAKPLHCTLDAPRG